MPRESRRSIIRSEDGAAYYVRSRTQSHTPLFEDPAIKSWLYEHLLMLGTIYCVSYQAIAIVDDSYRLVVKMERPELSGAELQRRFTTLQQSRRTPLKWYAWRSREWTHKFTDLSEFMKHLNQSTAKHVKNTLALEGHVWRDRFKAEYLASDLDLLACRAYVDLSAHRKGLSEDPAAYSWSSAGRASRGEETGVAQAPEHQSSYQQTLQELVRQNLGQATKEEIKSYLEQNSKTKG